MTGSDKIGTKLSAVASGFRMVGSLLKSGYQQCLNGIGFLIGHNLTKELSVDSSNRTLEVEITAHPRVFLVGSSALLDSELESFLKEYTLTGGTKLDYLDDNVPPVNEEDFIPEMAGRLCYTSFDNPRPGGNKGYLDHIKEVGHGSVLEHSLFNFILCDVSRSLTHELVRHRAGTAFSQLSQRYVDHTKEVKKGKEVNGWTFICPLDILCDPILREAWCDHMVECLNRYDFFYDRLKAKGLDRKTCREQARSVLPESTATKIFVSLNGRALRHFFQMRGSAGAAHEIRRLACHMWFKVKDFELFKDITYDPTNETLTLMFPDV